MYLSNHCYQVIVGLGFKLIDVMGSFKIRIDLLKGITPTFFAFPPRKSLEVKVTLPPSLAISLILWYCFWPT